MLINLTVLLISVCKFNKLQINVNNILYLLTNKTSTIVKSEWLFTETGVYDEIKNISVFWVAMICSILPILTSMITFILIIIFICKLLYRLFLILKNKFNNPIK